MNKKTIAIVGLGLIGGSMALALRRSSRYILYGLDSDPVTLMNALKRSAVDKAGGAELLAHADLVILALPPEATLAFLRDNAAAIKPGAVVTDVCGVKQAIVEPAAALCEAAGLTFIGGHPMAGKEKGGFDNADAALFEGACYILTPTPSTPAAVVDGMKELAAQLGCARMTVTTPAHHDRMIAFTSQLPHVLAGAYVKSPCCLYHAGFSAGSYRDVSRVASVDETLWTQLFLLNQTALCAEIDGLMERLQDCRDAVAAGDRQALTALLREGRERKEEADGALPPLPEHRKERTP